MAKSYWKGQHIRLRAMEPSDWESFYEWDQDSEMARRLYFIPPPGSKERQKQWANKQATEEPKEDEFFLVIESLEGQAVGMITSHHCHRRVGTFKYGVGVREEHQRKGYAAEAIVLLMRYFFQELRYQKCSADVYSFNQPSIRLHERLGFRLEGRIRREGFTDGQYFDRLIYGMTVEEFLEKYPQKREIEA